MAELLCQLGLFEWKVAVIMGGFYLCYRLFLEKETFHRFNRVVLLAILLLSFALPFCSITVYKEPLSFSDTTAVHKIPLWGVALSFIYLAGVVFMLLRYVLACVRVVKVVNKGERIVWKKGVDIVVCDNKFPPSSWLRFILIGKDDFESMREQGLENSFVIAHESAHVSFRHSIDILLVDLVSVFQWFNPVVRMLRKSLVALHEYEADSVVLRKGYDMKAYQLFLVGRAIENNKYPMACNLNRTALSERLEMMWRKPSSTRMKWKALPMLLVVATSILFNIQVVYRNQVLYFVNDIPATMEEIEEIPVSEIAKITVDKTRKTPEVKIVTR